MQKERTTLAVLSKKTGWSREHIKKLIQDGKIPTVTIGGKNPVGPGSPPPRVYVPTSFIEQLERDGMLLPKEMQAKTKKEMEKEQLIQAQASALPPDPAATTFPRRVPAGAVPSSGTPVAARMKAHPGIASVRPSARGPGMRYVKLWRINQTTGGRSYLRPLSSFPDNPQEVTRDLYPEGGDFQLTWFNPQNGEEEESEVYSVEGNGRHPRIVRADSPVAEAVPAAPISVQDEMLREAFNSAVHREDDFDERYERIRAEKEEAERKAEMRLEAERGKIRADLEAERSRLEHQTKLLEIQLKGQLDILETRLKAENERDRVFFENMATNAKQDAAAQAKRDQDFLLKMQEIEKARASDADKFRDKMIELERKAMDNQQENFKQMMGFQEQLLDQRKEHLEELKRLNDQKRPLEILFQGLASAAEKMADRLDKLIPMAQGKKEEFRASKADRPRLGDAGEGRRPEAGGGAREEPAREAESRRRREPAETPRREMTKAERAEAVSEISSLDDGEILQRAKNSPFFEQVVSGMAYCVNAGFAPSIFFARLLANDDPGVHFAIRAISRMDDPMEFLSPPHGPADEEAVQLLFSDGRRWIETLQREMRKWVEKNPEIFGEEVASAVVEEPAEKPAPGPRPKIRKVPSVDEEPPAEEEEAPSEEPPAEEEPPEEEEEEEEEGPTGGNFA